MRRTSLALSIASSACIFLSAIALVFGGDDAPAVGANSVASSRPIGSATSASFASDVAPFVSRYCYECHGDGNTSGDMALDALVRAGDPKAGKDAWLKVLRQVKTYTMPPPDAEQHPSPDEREQLVRSLHRQVYDIDPARPDPGRVTIRRLNQVEYRNTIRDLLGVSFDPTNDFPQDDTGYGFDNIADVLTLPPMLMEKYLAAADRIVDDAMPTERVERRERRVPATQASASFDARGRAARTNGDWVALTSKAEDAVSVAVRAPVSADYLVRVLAYADQSRGATTAPASPTTVATTAPSTPPVVEGPIRLSLMIGEVVIRDVAVTADEKNPQWYEARVGVTPGPQGFRAAVRRLRGPVFDKHISGGRVGVEQPGAVFVKEIVVDGPVSRIVRRLNGEALGLAGDGATHGDNGAGAALARTGDEAFAQVDVPANGQYLLRAQAYGEYAGTEPARMELLADGTSLGVFDVAAPPRLKRPAATPKTAAPIIGRAVPQVYEVPVRLGTGRRRLAARFVNNERDPTNPDPNFRDRNLDVQYLELADPSTPAGPPGFAAPVRALFDKATAAASSDEDGVARLILTDFTRSAWRRTPQSGEIDRLMKLYTFAREQGEDLRGGVKHAMKGVLVSPGFLLRGELQPQRDDSTSPRPVSEFELASRLSYFLWSSTPDDELLDLAEHGRLRQELTAQVRRMLASSKAQALSENFAGQWLQFRNLDAANPDDKLFPRYDERLRDAMKTETRMFFESIVRDDRSLVDVLTGDYTFVNERLAKHYGITGVTGEQFRRVSLASTPRRGVVTQGSVLTLTSNPTRTSPVKRGKWVLENLLGAAPPPPPPNIPALDHPGEKITGTLRQRMEMHRADVACASCHSVLDPIGFGLENFDAVGAWRDKDGDAPVDASSAFTDGARFNGARELVQLLAKTRRTDFLRAATEAAMTFALGRGVEPYDEPAVDQVVDQLRADDGRFSTLVLGVINSVPFQMRRGEVPAAAAAEVSREP